MERAFQPTIIDAVESVLQEIKRRRQRIVRPALQRERARTGGSQQREQHGLQDQRGAAGRARRRTGNCPALPAG
jgi:hypothetical protein